MLMTDDLAKRIAEDFKGKVLDGFTVDGLHRAGGTSVVLVATRNEKRVAIKIYAKDLFDESGTENERIERQIEKKDQIHPNLVRTHSAGVCPDTNYHYLIMDFVDDPTLEECVHDLPIDKIRTVIQQVAKAAIFMHQTLEQVHRDIKPANVAVSRDDFRVTLLDLGLVRPVCGSTLTDQGSQHIKGTKKYAPPELLDFTVELDSDGWLAVTFYQLGATLYEILTGRPPFDEYQGDELLQAIRTISPTIDAPDAPPDLVKLCLDCLHKSPQQRLQLVEWGRFLNSPKSSTNLEELEELLGTLRKAESTKDIFPRGAEEQHRLKRTYTEISNKAELSIRSLISEKESLFPNYSIDRVEEFETETTSILAIELDYSDIHPNLIVCIVVTIEITDASSRSCVCKVSTSTGKFETLPNQSSFRKIYEGAFVLEQFSSCLRNELVNDLKNVLKAAPNE